MDIPPIIDIPPITRWPRMPTGKTLALAGLAFGLVVGLLALVAVPLLLLALPLLPFLVIGGIIWLIARGGRAVAVRA